MKKSILILTLFAMVTAGAFAQDISLDMRVSRVDLNGTEAGAPSFIPGLGLAVGLGAVEILLDLEFWRTGENDEYSVTGFTEELSWALNYFSIAAGVAPVVPAAQRLTLTFPIMLQFARASFNSTLSETGQDDIDISIARNSFGLNFGARTFLSISQNWSVFLGAQISPVTVEFTPSSEVSSGGTTIDLMEDQTLTTTTWFGKGRIDLGVRFRF